MSWRSATPTTGMSVTVDYRQDREKQPISIAAAREILERGRKEQGCAHAIADAFYEASIDLLDRIEAVFPDATIEMATAGHADDVNGGYGSITFNVHARD